MWTEEKMQIALTRQNCLFYFRLYAVVPNVSWGLGLNHEADLLCLSNNNVFHEVEIKISIADLKADCKKKHDHYSRFIRHLWFAVPDTLPVDTVLVEIPEYAGLIVVHQKNGFYKTKIIRRPRPKLRTGVFKKPEPRTIEKFLRLGVMRMWSYKK